MPIVFAVSAPPIERVIAIPEEVSRGLVPGERFAQLLGGPRRGGMVGDGDVHDASALVRDEHQDEQQTARRRGDDEEVGGHHRKGVGDSLAGGGDHSRRHGKASAAVRKARADVATSGVGDPGSKAGRGVRQESTDTVSRDLSHAGQRMADHGAADVQALDAEASPLHAREASVAAVR